MSAIDAMLAEARRGLRRMQPNDALNAMRDGALLVDTRPVEQRQRDGHIPGAIVVDRNVLEWRLDPSCPQHIPQVRSVDEMIIVICNQGFSSSLVAANLQRLGMHRATDVVGGFEAWAAEGLPVVPATARGEAQA